MTKNEIVRRLREAGINASSTDRSAAAYVEDAVGIRATAGWFGFRITCDTQATERRVRVVLERYYEVEVSGGVWRMRTKRRLSVMASGGLFPPAPTPTKSPMYLEAAEANSTVSMVSTLETAPNFEYSTDGVTWQEWGYTDQTDEGITIHFFDTITFGAIGDKVYFRGDNPNGLASNVHIGQLPYSSSFFKMTGTLSGGGDITSLLDKDNAVTVIPSFGFTGLFADLMNERNTSLLNSFDMTAIISIGEYGCYLMYGGCTSLTAAAAMPALTTIGDNGCKNMYQNCTFDMSDDGTTLNFAFPTPPVTAGETTYATAYEVADWMGNTNGFQHSS